MSIEAKAPKGRGKRGPGRRIAEPLFITKTEMAQHLGVGDMTSIDKWIAAGDFPPPHSQPGKRFAVWLRRHWNTFVETRAWPREAFPHRAD